MIIYQIFCENTNGKPLNIISISLLRYLVKKKYIVVFDFLFVAHPILEKSLQKKATFFNITYIKSFMLLWIFCQQREIQSRDPTREFNSVCAHLCDRRANERAQTGRQTG